MAIISFFNELSEPPENTSADEARAIMIEFARVVIAARKRRPDFGLQLPQPLKAWRLGNSYTFDRFYAEAPTRDLGRSILSNLDRSPIRFGLDPNIADDNTIDYEHGGRRAEGLGLAHLFDGLAISFGTGESWEFSKIELGRSQLQEDENGKPILAGDTVEVTHASTTDHIATHHQWLESTGKTLFTNFGEFLAKRTTRLSKLKFLDRTLKQIEDIKPGTAWWKAIFERLDELQAAVIEWDPTKSPRPNWRSHVTGEKETRQRLCYFLDLDGEQRCFDEHARFTPGAGRIHFRLDISKGKSSLVVAHVGEKLR